MWLEHKRQTHSVGAVDNLFKEKSMKYIGIVGSRSRDSQDDYDATEKVFLKMYEKGDEIVSGGCPQDGDRFAEIIAKKHDIPIIIFPAEWAKYGRGAGFVRNTDIAKKSGELLAVVAPDRRGGTEDTVKKFHKFHPTKKARLV